MENLKKQLLEKAKTIVIKVGTHVLTLDNGCLNLEKIKQLSNEIAFLKQHHQINVILVSSGAIGAAMGHLGLNKRPKVLSEIQALACVGQVLLVENYRKYFNKNNLEIGQLLVTREDFYSRKRYLNIKNTLDGLLNKNITPVLNENDSVSTEEVTFGDNDQLASLVSQMIQADLVVILSNVEGFLDTAHGNKLLHYIEKIDQSILNMVSNSKSSRGLGGMASKLEAIQNLSQTGEPVLLASGDQENLFKRLLDNEEIGTLFLANKTRMQGKKKWIGFSALSKGSLKVDAGAAKALTQKNSSLLAIGIKEVNGSFKQGDTIEIFHSDQLIGRGIVNYSKKNLSKIIGLKNSDINSTLDHNDYDCVVHKDNLVIQETSELH